MSSKAQVREAFSPAFHNFVDIDLPGGWLLVEAERVEKNLWSSSHESQTQPTEKTGGTTALAICHHFVEIMLSSKAEATRK